MADAKKNESFGRMVNVKSTKDRKKKMKIRKNNIKSGKNLIWETLRNQKCWREFNLVDPENTYIFAGY